MCFKQFITIVLIVSGRVKVPGVLHYTCTPTTKHNCVIWTHATHESKNYGHSLNGDNIWREKHTH